MLPPDKLDLMNEALADLYGGWHFYIRSALIVETLDRMWMRSKFQEYALHNADQIIELGDLIMFHGGTPTTTVTAWRNDLRNPKDILLYASNREKAMAARYDELPHVGRFRNTAVSRTNHFKQSAAGI